MKIFHVISIVPVLLTILSPMPAKTAVPGGDKSSGTFPQTAAQQNFTQPGRQSPASDSFSPEADSEFQSELEKRTPPEHTFYLNAGLGYIDLAKVSDNPDPALCFSAGYQWCSKSGIGAGFHYSGYHFDGTLYKGTSLEAKREISTHYAGLETFYKRPKGCHWLLSVVQGFGYLTYRRTDLVLNGLGGHTGAICEYSLGPHVGLSVNLIAYNGTFFNKYQMVEVDFTAGIRFYL